LKILIIGMGSAGKRHKLICESLGHEVGGWDLVGEWPAIDWDWPDKVFVCTPPAAHYDDAVDAIFHKKDVFIEKPLGLPSEIEDWGRLLKTADKNGTGVAVGYQLRYNYDYQCFVNAVRDKQVANTGIVWTAAMFWYTHDLRTWRAGDYRKGYICLPREEGGGIIMDASHEIDVAGWALGKLEVVSAIGSDCFFDGMKSEAYAYVTMHGDVGICGVSLDGVRPYRERGGIVFFSDGTSLRVDFEGDMLKTYLDQDRTFLDGMPLLSTGWTALETLKIIKQAHDIIGGENGR
jgi:predicted dehydrogenase